MTELPDKDYTDKFLVIWIVSCLIVSFQLLRGLIIGYNDMTSGMWIGYIGVYITFPLFYGAWRLAMKDGVKEFLGDILFTIFNLIIVALKWIAVLTIGLVILWVITKGM
jgi:hypothetical protein